MGLAYELRGVWKVYGSGDGAVAALRGIDLDIDDSEFLAIMGPSGSGKTTLLDLLGLLARPTRGSLRLFGEDVTEIPDSRSTEIRRNTIGFVFQTFNLVPWLSALDNVELALAIGGYRGDRRERARRLLESVGLGGRLNHRPSQMSGGEQQRVAIARALANDPRIILADEPTGNLDSESGRKIVGLLRDLSRSGRCVVMVTHDEEMAALADRIVRLRDGVIVG